MRPEAVIPALAPQTAKEGLRRLSTAPAKPMAPAPKAALIAGLRSRILRLEGHAALPAPSSSFTPLSAHPPQGRQRWDLGCPSFDERLPKGLETASVHEIKGSPSKPRSASAADWMAAIGFAARLAVRRMEALASATAAERASWVLWCWPKALAGEFGTLSASGIARLGLDPVRLLIVETARADETLHAIEEGLRARSLLAVIGVVGDVDLTPARRLSLAAGEGATPCLLITHPASEAAAATATRWRIARAASAEHAFDPRAPGAARFKVALERCRARPQSAAGPPELLEWSDETRRFGLASLVADLPAEARRTRGGAVGPAVRAP